jgi:chemotaxis protein methyltransferase CheR
MSYSATSNGGAAMTADGFVLSDADFHWLRRAAQDHSGIMLPEAKRTMIFGRLSKRLRALGLRDFHEYRRLLEQPGAGEFREFINSLTTNLTYFYREPHHFEHLAKVALPERMAANGQSGLSVWSAAASSGEEAYSAVMTVFETSSSANLRVLATDLDTQTLAKGRAGIYSTETVADMDGQRLSRWFLRGRGAYEGKVRVKPELQDPIEFREFNLVKPWKLPEVFDVVFCRNVVIYFDKPTQRELFARIADVLAPGGYLYLGHSETLFGVSEEFELVGKTIYRKPA